MLRSTLAYLLEATIAVASSSSSSSTSHLFTYLVIVAMAASLVSSVVAAGSVTSSSAPVVAAARSSASCTALLSPYGASFKTGVAVPAVARSAGYRTGTVSPPVLVGEFRALYVSRGVIRRRVVFALSILKVAFERAEELSA